ncbi:hypothetical protein [Niabella ginsengisoli]|uniref:Virion structural protein n=1 Tax=Niabella ginsengisoli TaxID=522298 RepID=A0ABS9SJN3_9BACT|nr:hypothetical protein [Niabella ginsengisoli]MCH5598597.1 hypothetical protein [Niabella ginsengisoli]
MFYFTSLKELDLTGGAIFEMTKTSYNANGVSDVVGGGTLVPFARRAGNMPTNNAQYLIDLLEAGTLTKVKYIPNSMGIDDLLAPYISNGKVELVNNKPDEAFVDFRFLLDGRVQTNDWKMSLEAPASAPPAGTDLQNVIKATLESKNSSFVLSLPKEYEFDMQQYKYLKFKVYAPKKADVSGTYDVYKRLWPRVMNYMWAYPQESTFGQQYWDNGKDSYTISDANLEKWIDVTIDFSKAIGRHNRVVVINIGGEPSLTYESSKTITYYFSNFRFTKN